MEEFISTRMQAAVSPELESKVTLSNVNVPNENLRSTVPSI